MLVAVVSDGAGSAMLGKQGSALTCRTITETARTYFNNSAASPTDELLWDWIDQCRERIILAARLRGAKPRDFAATLVAVFALPSETIIMHIGDGAAVINVDGQWLVPSWPAHGEYASTTFFITDDPNADLRITRLPYRIDAAAAFSDGIERLVLKFADQTASATFFDKFAGTVRAAKKTGCTPELNIRLGEFLDSPTINERTDDDKSLIIAVRQ
jgi:hypothetical protein